MFNSVSVYFAESIETIADNLKEIKPNVMTAVPRLLEKVYDKIYNLDSYNGAIKWNGRDLNGNHVSNGIYFIKMHYSQSANKSPQDYWDKLIVVK